MLAWLVGLMMASTSPAILTIPVVHAEEIDNSTYTLQQYATDKAKENHLNVKKFMATIDCESKWNPYAEGDLVRGKPTSFGLVQLRYPGRWGISTSSAYNPRLSIDIMTKAWKENKYKEWSCWWIVGGLSPPN